MLGTAGHVDHGKSALVKLLTGCETDTLAEEKERGLTIDLGFAPCRLADDRVVGVVDVPGHVDFIRNMVAGAHGVDVVMFVVAADDGLMPQTHEHLHILTLMGLRHGLVALTKIDLVDAARRQAVTDDLRRLLAGTFLARAPICPLSNVTGEGFEAFFDALNQVVAACEDRPGSGLFRVWVEDVFTIRGPGTVITGIPTRGRVRVGDTLRLLPGGLAGHVRRMQVYGQDASEASAGECVALNLPELDHAQARRGMVLSVGGEEPVTMAEAELLILDGVKGKVEDYLEAHLHVGTAAVLARVAMLETTEMSAGQRQMVQLRLAEPLPLAPGERYVLRANLPGQGPTGLITIGGGRLLGVSNQRLRRKRQWTLAALAARREALDDAAAWCALMLRESRQPLAARELAKKCYLPPEELALMVKRLRDESRVVEAPNGALAHRGVVEELAAKMLATLQAFHRANPDRAGLGRAELFGALGEHAELCELAAQALLRTRQIEAPGTVLTAAGWRAKLTGDEEGLTDQVATAFQNAGWAGPSGAELAAALKQPAGRIEKAMRLLAERGALVDLGAQVYIHRDALEAAKRTALALFAKKPSFSTMDFRDALGVSRKYAVPIVDYLDSIRFTVRSGHDRTPGAEARKAQDAGAANPKSERWNP
jgi:selenocysteine-specific elongation factor